MTFLLDTNVVSELARAKRSPRVVAWMNSIDANSLHVSVLTLGEIAKGIAKLYPRDPVRSAEFARRLEDLRAGYADRIIVVDADIAETWGHMSARRTLPIVDGLLAATALVHGLTLVTRNVRDVADLGVPVLNPWE